jgi:hypothetical protein
MTLTAAVGLLAMLAVPAFAQQPQPQSPDPARPQPQPSEPVGSKLARLQVSAEEFDFGRVPQGATISHIFWLKNIGEDTLRITDIKPG